MTPKLQQVYQFIRHYVQQHSCPPTLSEIAAGVNISSTGLLCRYLIKLERLSLITRTDKKTRNIQITENPNYINTELAIIGKIAAGEPIALAGKKHKLDITKHLFADNRRVFHVRTHHLEHLHIKFDDYLLTETRLPKLGEKTIVIDTDNNIMLLTLQKKIDDYFIFYAEGQKNTVKITDENANKMIKGVFVGIIRLEPNATQAIK